MSDNPLKRWSERTNVSLGKLSRDADVSQGTVYRISNGEKSSFRTAVALSKATGGDVSVLELMAGDEFGKVPKGATLSVDENGTGVLTIVQNFSIEALEDLKAYHGREAVDEFIDGLVEDAKVSISDAIRRLV